MWVWSTVSAIYIKKQQDISIKGLRAGLKKKTATSDQIVYTYTRDLIDPAGPFQNLFNEEKLAIK
jgi:hypothetical protein